MHTMTNPVDLVVARLNDHGRNPTPRGDSWQARCPAHEDSNPSLSLTAGDDGRALLKCHAGCELTDVLAALQLEQRDLFTPQANGTQKREIVATYPYVDEAGQLLYEAVRYQPKDFRQRRPDGNGGWIWKLDELDKAIVTRRVLYRLPAVLEAVATGHLVWIVEGEKDADALQAVLPHGEVATTNAMGAGKWRPEYTETLRGAGVMIWADADDKGRAHARAVATHLEPVAATVVVVESPRFKDAAEHLGAGLTLDDIIPGNLDLEHDASEANEVAAEVLEQLESWRPVDLKPYLDGTYQQPRPDLLRTADNHDALLYRSAINGIHGDSGIGKSWLADLAAVQVVAMGQRVTIVDYEANAGEVTTRLLLMGCTPQQIDEQVDYIHPHVAGGELAIATLLESLTADTALVIIDSLGEAFSLDGIDENKDVEVGPWFRHVARRIADAGPAVLLIDHATKAADNPLHPSGSKRKRAAITGASYLIEAKVTPTREQPGTLTIKCAKDRHGTYARGLLIATVDITPYPDGGVTVKITQAAAAPAEDGRVESVARAAVRALKDHGAAVSKNELIGLMGDKVKGSKDVKLAGIATAVARGAIDVEPGPNRRQLHRYKHDLDSAVDDLLELARGAK